MDARPTAEQRELEAAASRLAEKLGPGTVGGLGDLDRRDRLDASIVQAGWRQLRTGSVDEPLASGVEAAMVARVLARGACDVAFIGPVLAHDLTRRAGLPTDDDAAITIAVTTDLRSLATSDGVAVDAAGSSGALLLIDGAVAEAPIDGRHPASDETTGHGVDLTRHVTSIGPAPGAPSARGSLTADDLLAWEALAVTLTAADLVGVMEGALALTVDYAKDRRQYGAPIGSFQAVQHLLAEAKALTEGALSATEYAAWAVDALDPVEARMAAAVAKAYAGRGARTVCETAIQVHGGIGNTWECMAHVYLRRALLSTELFGSDGAQLSLLAARRWGATDGLS